MKVWKRAAGVLKDQNSIWLASLSRRTSHRNPDLETAIIKATSHDEFHVDYKNAQRVFAWLRTSPLNLKPLVWGLSRRIDKTRSWVVALKGLILMHGVFCCKVPTVQEMGRLPFDLSNFHDGHLRPTTSCPFNNFVRAYYSFLDQRSTFLYDQNRLSDGRLLQELVRLQKYQSLLDSLFQIKPNEANMKVALIIEAMDCVLIEIYDVYSRICSGVARVLLKISSAKKVEVSMALKVLQKATQQSEQLASYLEYCRDFGVLNMMEIPKVIQIPEQDIKKLERMINGVSDQNNNSSSNTKIRSDDLEKKNEEKAIVIREDHDKRALTTIITDKWEIFEEEEEEDVVHDAKNPFTESDDHDPYLLPLIPVSPRLTDNLHDLPDLINF